MFRNIQDCLTKFTTLNTLKTIGGIVIGII